MDRFQGLRRFWRLLAHYLWPQRRRLGLLAATLAGTIGVQIISPLLASRFIDQAVAGSPLQTLLTLAGLTIALAIVGQLLAVGETYLAEQLSWTATNALRIDLLTHLLRLDPAFFNAHTPGELIERVDGDIGALARFFSRFIALIVGNSIFILGVLVLLWFVDWRVALGLTFFVGVAFAVLLWVRSFATPLSAVERQETAHYYGFLGEYLAGLEDVRSSGAGSFVLRRCAEVMRPWYRAFTRAQLLGYLMYISSFGLFTLGTVTALGLGIWLYGSGTLTLGTVYLLYRYTEMLRQPLQQIPNELQDLQRADASLGRVEQLLATTPRLHDGPGQALPAGPLTVEFAAVTFGYDAAAPVLHQLNLRLEPGRVLGVVGRTGSGKTSLTRLLPRFYDPQAGAVLLGGVDVRTVQLAAVRERIGLVSQDIHLFAATVRQNLTLFDETVPDPQLRQVLDQLGLLPWLDSLPAGLDTPLGVQGVGLSAGQAQLLTCARIFLHNPDIVILDEASSRLDPVTERLLHTALERLLTGRTGLIVAHRLDTMSFADDILVLDHGRVLEYGPRLTLAADPTSHFAGLLRLAAEEVNQ